VNRCAVLVIAWVSCLVAPTAAAQAFRFPTANQALLEPGREDQFFVGAVGKPWTTGTFGCVRTEGHQLHEGLDIRCLQRDSRGEPIDPVMATAEGIISYINPRPALSNYGRYLVIQHAVPGLDIYSLYAHLSHVRDDLKVGSPVKAGEVVAIMGRSSNTREGISKDRAHVHFEVDIMINERFAAWFDQTFPGQRNDHGQWNGRNLLGIDPAVVLKESATRGSNFSLLDMLRRQREMCRVVVKQPSLSWVRRNPALMHPNPRAQKEGVAGYELALNFMGIPFEFTPRSAAELQGIEPFQLQSTSEVVVQTFPCQHIVTLRHGRWELSHHGQEQLELFGY